MTSICFCSKTSGVSRLKACHVSLRSRQYSRSVVTNSPITFSRCSLFFCLKKSFLFQYLNTYLIEITILPKCFFMKFCFNQRHRKSITYLREVSINFFASRNQFQQECCRRRVSLLLLKYCERKYNFQGRLGGRSLLKGI